jgi:mercuric ion binding protein
MTQGQILKETTMKTLLSVATALLLLASPALAGPKTVTLTVSKMTCAACPITVKQALTKVDGVSKAAIDFDKKEAVVTFDDAKTSAAALIKATTDAGYPSTVKGAAKK